MHPMFDKMVNNYSFRINRVKIGVQVLFTLSLFILFSTSSYAQHINYDEHHVNIHHKHGNHHHIEVFTNYYEGFVDLVELDYEYIPKIWKSRIGISAVFSRDLGEREEWSLAFPIYLHPYRGLKVFMGPGFIHIPEGSDGDGRSQYLTRVGIAYDFHYGRFTVSPTFNFDIQPGDTLKDFGVALGYLF